MYKSFFIPAALAILQAHAATARLCTVQIMRDDYVHIVAHKNIGFPKPTTKPFHFKWKIHGVTYNVEVLYEQCEAKIYKEPALPDGLVIKGHIKGSHV